MKTVGIVACVILGIAAFPIVFGAFFRYVFWMSNLIFGGFQ